MKYKCAYIRKYINFKVNLNIFFDSMNVANLINATKEYTFPTTLFMVNISL